MAARSLKITYASSHYVLGRHDGVRLRIDVSCATGVASEVFAYRMLPVDPHGQNEGFFSHICSPVDLADFPSGGPCPGSSPEWFRLSFIDILVRSVEEADNFISVVKCDLKRLLDTLCIMDTLMPGDDALFLCGGGVDCTPDPATSSSSSSSASLSSESVIILCTDPVIGTSELSSGVGVSWLSGEAFPVLGSESLSSNSSSSLSLVSTCVELCAGQASQLLLVHGFDFSGIPDDAIVRGITSYVRLRDATDADAASSSSSASLPSCVSLPGPQPDCPRLSFLTLQHPTLGLGTNLAADACVEGPDWDTIVHGDATELWGFEAFRAEELKDGSFGLGIVVRADFYTPVAKVCVADVNLVVCYEAP